MNRPNWQVCNHEQSGEIRKVDSHRLAFINRGLFLMWASPCDSVLSRSPLFMAIMRHLRFKPHNLLRAWTILWLIAIPLFHIHPESDPHHGRAGHVHSGTVHTVFSGDLDGEFGHHRDKASSATVSPSGWFLSAEGPYDWKADPELG